MNFVVKIWKNKWIFRSILSTIYFNFHYLPIKQAIRLPILLYKPHFVKCKGQIVIDYPKIKFGMIILGKQAVSIYPNNGIIWENHGGYVAFKGKCFIGNNSSLSFGEKTKVVFGEDFLNTSSLKLVSYRGISFGQSSRIGWDCLIMDTNFHPLFDLNKNKFKKASGPIEIGDFNWFGTQCKIMHSVKTPERCIFGMNSIITKGCEMKSYCVMGGSPIRILNENVMRIIGQDTEIYD